MVRELKIFKAHYQKKTEDLKKMVQNSVSAFEDVVEKILSTDPTFISIIKPTRKIIASLTKRNKESFEMYKRKLRDLEEIKIDAGKHCTEKQQELFLPHEIDAITIADKKVTNDVLICIADIEKNTAILTPFSELH